MSLIYLYVGRQARAPAFLNCLVSFRTTPGHFIFLGELLSLLYLSLRIAIFCSFVIFYSPLILIAPAGGFEPPRPYSPDALAMRSL